MTTRSMAEDAEQGSTPSGSTVDEDPWHPLLSELTSGQKRQREAELLASQAEAEAEAARLAEGKAMEEMLAVQERMVAAYSVLRLVLEYGPARAAPRSGRSEF